MSQDPITLTRDVEAVIVPAGDQVTLAKGERAYLFQSLGDSHTVVVNGNTFRIDGKDADALGLQPPPRPAASAPATPSDKAVTREDLEKQAWDAMRSCYDPEIPVNVVDLGLIYGCRVETRADGQREVVITMTLTEPSCGMGDVIACDVRGRIERIPTVAVAHVNLVFDPPWTRDRMSEVAKLTTGLF